MEKSKCNIETSELPDGLREKLDSYAAHYRYDPDALRLLSNDCICWADDLERNLPPEECHYPEVREKYYPEIKTAAHARAASAYLDFLAAKHAPEVTARKKAQQEWEDQHPPRPFGIEDAPVVAALAALETGSIGSREALEWAVNEVIQHRMRELLNMGRKKFKPENN